MLRSHRCLLPNWFRARGQVALIAVEGLNNKAKVTSRKAYGYRSFDVLKVTLYHDLPSAGGHPQILLTNHFFWKSSIVKNTLLLSFSKFFEKGLMFLFFVLMAHHFGREKFGEFSYYFTLASMLFVLFDMGGEFYQIREFTKNESIKIFQNIFLTKTILAIFVFALCMILKRNIYLSILVISFYLDSIISIFKSSLYKNSLYRYDSVFSIIEKCTFIALVYINIFTVKMIIMMYLPFIFAKFTYIIVSTHKFYKFRYIYHTFRVINLSYIKKYIINSWSYVLHALLVVVFVQIDIVMLKYFGISYENIGLYSSAVRIYLAVVIFADILFKQYYPKVSKLIFENENKNLEKYILKIQSLNIYVSTILAFLTMFFAQNIISLSFGAEFVEASRMLILLSVVIVFRFSMYTYTALLSSSSLNYIKMVTSITCVIVNVGLNSTLIPRYGVYGALSATIITEFLLVSMYKISSFRIVFTNIITIKEISSIIIVFVSAYVFFNNNVGVTYRFAIGTLLIITLLISKAWFKTALTFEGV